MWQDSVSKNSKLPKLRKVSSDPVKRSFTPEKILPDIESDIPLRPARCPPRQTIFDYLPILFIFKPIVSLVKRLSKKKGDEEEDIEGLAGTRNAFGKRRHIPPVESNVPLEGESL